MSAASHEGAPPIERADAEGPLAVRLFYEPAGDGSEASDGSDGSEASDGSDGSDGSEASDAPTPAGSPTPPALPTAPASPRVPRTLTWDGGVDGRLTLIDQRCLPLEETWLVCERAAQAHEAIRTLAVRGAPAIGVAGAYGLVLALAEEAGLSGDAGDAGSALAANASASARIACARERAVWLESARPTAVNLGWAIRRVMAAIEQAAARPRAEGEGDAESDADGSADSAGWLAMQQAALTEAQAIEAEDRAMCAAIGAHGAALVRDGARVVTHCHAGALATAGIGTALGVLHTAHAQGKRLAVFARETRPLLQGARITSWELSRSGIDVTLIGDSMAGTLMRRRGVDLVIVGADRIAANGDVANKIGTYELALVAKAHGVPFYVAAPSSTFDLSLPDGDAIPIEEREGDEVRGFRDARSAPADVPVWNPAFDVTPADLIAAIITERGIIARPTRESIALHLTP